MKPSPTLTWPERTRPVRSSKAITALGRAPPAEVPIARIARIAASVGLRDSSATNSSRRDSSSLARPTSRSTRRSASTASCSSAGSNSRAPMPRVPV